MKPDSEHETDALRSDIDETRQRMDQTIDDLGDRLRPRHLLDEFLGHLRGDASDGDSRMQAMREKISRGASQAANSVVQTIKENPLPALAIGAGIAWLIYESRRDKTARGGRAGPELEYDPDVHYDRPLEYPPGYGTEGQIQFDENGESEAGEPEETTAPAGETIAGLGEKTREKISALKGKAGEKLHAVREHAAEMGTRVKEKAGAAYGATRDRVVSTADQHPLEVGLGCLAAGLIAGLLLPTPARLDRAVGPAADRLRQRARTAGAEALEKSKRVARAAAAAAKSEADAQGLTPERLRQSAKQVAQRAGAAASETARSEGLAPAAQDAGPRSGSADPASNRPGV